MVSPELKNGKGSLGVPLTWQQEVKRAIRDPYVLCRDLGLDAETAERAVEAAAGFPLFAPYPYVARIRPGDPRDPLLRQILPVAEEQGTVAGFHPDPVADLAAQSSPGVIRKYQGRALLILSGACAVHCRYCFRRHFPYSDVPVSIGQWREPLAELAQDPSLHELILSGGDPLTLRDELLGELVEHLQSLPHLRRLRIHTRLPVVIPQRVTEALLELFEASPWRLVVVLHINHAQEVDPQLVSAVERLRKAGAWVMNQSVLLRGVNDNLEALVALSEVLIDCQIVPYYLHQLDRVSGAAHFEVPIERGRELFGQLQRALPGYAVPRYVQEQPGAASKQWLL
jgi:EF-P beta-lysylation protein EpmB